MQRLDNKVAKRDLSLWPIRTKADATKGIYHIAPCRDKKGVRISQAKGITETSSKIDHE